MNREFLHQQQKVISSDWTYCQETANGALVILIKEHGFVFVKQGPGWMMHKFCLSFELSYNSSINLAKIYVCLEYLLVIFPCLEYWSDIFWLHSFLARSFPLMEWSPSLWQGFPLNTAPARLLQVVDSHSPLKDIDQPVGKIT